MQIEWQNDSFEVQIARVRNYTNVLLRGSSTKQINKNNEILGLQPAQTTYVPEDLKLQTFLL